MQFVYESNVTVANRAKTSDNLSYVNDFIGLGLAVSMVRREASNVKENWPTNGKTRSSYLCAYIAGPEGVAAHRKHERVLQFAGHFRSLPGRRPTCLAAQTQPHIASL